MKSGQVLWALCCLAGVNEAAAQSLAPRDYAIFELTQPIEPDANFNWYRQGTRREHGAHQAMWEPLFVLDLATGKLEGWLAEKIEPNDDMDEWTLTLREGVEWSDGEEFDADDVVYTVDMVMREETLPAFEAAEMRRSLKPNTVDSDGDVVVNGVEKIDDVTVLFKLREKDPRFALRHFGGGLFGSFLIMPQHLWPQLEEIEGEPDRFDPPIAEFEWDEPIGTGPYALESYSTTKVVWKRRSTWWGVGEELGGASSAMEMPEPASLEWLFVGGDETASKDLLIANGLDAAREYTKAAFDDARGKNPAIIGWSTLVQPGPGPNPPPPPAPEPNPTPVNEALAWNEPCGRQLEINTKVVPWNDPNMRKALYHLIDRTRLAEISYDNTTTPSKTMFAEYGAMQPYIDAILAAKFEPPEVAKAKPLILAAGYKEGDDGVYVKQVDGARLNALITVNKDVAKDQAAAAALEAQLDAAGLDASLVLVSNQDYWGRDIPTGQYALAYGWLSCGSLVEPYSSMARYRKTDAQPIGARSFNNTGRWDSDSSKKYEEALDKIKVLPIDDATIPDLVVEAYTYIDADTPFIPLVQTPRIVPFNTTHWIGWPSAEAGGVPMHSWGRTHLLIHALEKAPPPPPPAQ